MEIGPVFLGNMVTRDLYSHLTVISVSFNSGEVFLAHWKEFLDSTGFDVIIVDNASSDNSGSLLSHTFTDHRVVRSENNVGYGRAANLGIKQCRSRFALLLNPDMRVTEKDVMQLLNTALQDTENTAIWAPATSKIDYQAGARPYPIEAVCGAAMLFDLNRMSTVGMFDENIFLYSEETDLCYRTRQKGYVIKLCPGVYLDHLGASSSGHHQALIYMKSWHFAWSRCYYLNKHALFTRKYNPRRMYQDYKVKSFVSLSKVGRLRYRGQAEGVKAFMRGEKAFAGDGKPQASPG